MFKFRVKTNGVEKDFNSWKHFIFEINLGSESKLDTNTIFYKRYDNQGNLEKHTHVIELKEIERLAGIERLK